MNVRIRFWWPVIAWMVVIGTLTTLPISPGTWTQSVPHVDKLVHFLLYLGLGWLLGRAVGLSKGAGRSLFVLALLGGILFAAADEWHQEMLPTRQASLADWLADTGGVWLGLFLYKWAARQRRRTGQSGQAGDERE